MLNDKCSNAECRNDEWGNSSPRMNAGAFLPFFHSSLRIQHLAFYLVISKDTNVPSDSKLLHADGHQAYHDDPDEPPACFDTHS